MGGVADPGQVERLPCDAADRDHLTAVGESVDEAAAGLALSRAWACGSSGIARPVRMRRHGVPEQDVVGEPEPLEDAVDDRRRGLGRAGTGELALGRERDPRDARAPVAGRLADQQEAGARPGLEVCAQAALAAALRRDRMR